MKDSATKSHQVHYLGDFDPHFMIFHELMPFKVQEILLVSSPYDAYIMEEDNSMTSRIINEYYGLNLSRPPRITSASSAEQALDILTEKSFDLVITMPHVGEMDGYRFATEVKKKFSLLPVVLLTHSVRDASTLIDNHSPLCVDDTYVWCCDSDILLAIVKNVEDRHNVDSDTRKAMVRVILLVEDSALYRSQLLPLLYGEVVHQTQSVLDEGLNEKHRLLKMRARPKILTASNYEEAKEFFSRYEQYIFCVMSDARFPKNGKMCDDAGLQLLKTIRQHHQDLPLLLLSTELENKKLAKAVPAVFVDKTAVDIDEQVHDFFLRYLGFGDFIFRLSDGTEVGRAGSLHDFEEQLKKVPAESLFYHARHNHFSNWIMARAEIALAARLHKRFYFEVTNGDALREDLIFKIHALRKLRQQGVISQFDRKKYDPETTDFVRMGKGSMGGKARGLAFIATRLYRSIRQGAVLSEQLVTIPQTCVISADGFDDFVQRNELHYKKGESDSAIAHRFLHSSLPDWLEQDLRAFLEKIRAPLSVRSSSLLEDAQFRPYAGLYKTFMLVNGAADEDIRFQHLQQAVKLVYASTWFADPRAFSRSIGQSRDDSMAVIIQQLAGSRYNGHFYPAISGVAQSYNYYPVAPMRSEDGIAHVAIGLGKTVVEGEQSLRFSPEFPENLPQFSTVDDILTNAQRWMYSLDCTDSEHFYREQNLVRVAIDEVSGDYPIRQLSSTYSSEEHRIRDGDQPGAKIATFASILKYKSYPLPGILKELLVIGKEGMGCEVEIEFAVDLHPDPTRCIFYFLQIRPIVTGSEKLQVRIREEERKIGILRSKRALGHGRYETICDIVFVRPDTFESSQTRKIATEISRFNGGLHKADRPYLLIGPGRWGTADPWLGIPVQWGDISGVGAIVELQGDTLRAEPSQGSHFFQNITSLGIPYLMVQDEQKTMKDAEQGEFIDWNFFQGLEILREENYTVHARLPGVFVLKVDGHTSEAVLYNPVSS
jgi:CheY-like chemotaxis protein